jgi:aryl-alcohol dehydrogenase-like predicted oxidoreductase
MRPMAEARGVSVARIAIAWLLHRPFVTTVIVGARNTDQLDDNIAATEITLSAQELATLDKVSALPAEYPGWMIARQNDGRLPG